MNRQARKFSVVNFLLVLATVFFLTTCGSGGTPPPETPASGCNWNTVSWNQFNWC